MAPLAAANLRAQSQITLTVEDSHGAAIGDAQISDSSGHLLAHSDNQGVAAFACPTPCRVRISAAGFEPQAATPTGAATISLLPASTVEQVTVTAYRAPLGVLESPVTTRLLTQTALQRQPRHHPRRADAPASRRGDSFAAPVRSSPIPPRRESACAASVPPLPAARSSPKTMSRSMIRSAAGFTGRSSPSSPFKPSKLVRGGASDLYGSSAIGGVVNMIPMQPSPNFARSTSSYGGEGTYDNSLLAPGQARPVGSPGRRRPHRHRRLHPGERHRSAAPSTSASNVHSQNALLLGRPRSQDPLAFRRATAIQRARATTELPTRPTARASCATPPAQIGKLRTAPRSLCVSTAPTSATARPFRAFRTRPTPATPACTYRCGESPSKFSCVPDNELGAAAHWSQPFGAGLLARRRSRRARCPRLGSRADLRRNSAAHQSRRPSARLRPPTLKPCGSTRPGRSTASAPHGLVPELTTATKRNGTAQPGFLRPLSRRNDADASSIRASVSRASCRRTGHSLHRGSAPSARPRPASYIAPRRSATSSPCPTAICSASAPPDGRQASPRAALGQYPLQLLPHPGQPPHRRAHYQSQLVAHPAHARESRPDRKPRRLHRFRARSALLARRSTAATSTPTPSSRAALRISAIGFPRSRATWPRSICAHPARVSEPQLAKPPQRPPV